MGKAGEKLTMRLRLAVYRVRDASAAPFDLLKFQNLLSQDGAFFDHPDHSVGTLTARLNTDAPNVQNAIDQVSLFFCCFYVLFFLASRRLSPRRRRLDRRVRCRHLFFVENDADRRRCRDDRRRGAARPHRLHEEARRHGRKSQRIAGKSE